jgi:hypothetical protein
MLSKLLRGQSSRNPYLDSAPEGGTINSRDERITAWSLLGGEARASRYPKPGRRPHRGTLPDVDFGRVVADPNPRPPVLIRFVRLLRRLLRRKPRRATAAASASLPPGRTPSGLGERPPGHYMGVTEAGDPMDFLRAGQASQIDYPRAA